MDFYSEISTLFEWARDASGIKSRTLDEACLSADEIYERTLDMPEDVWLDALAELEDWLESQPTCKAADRVCALCLMLEARLACAQHSPEPKSDVLDAEALPF